MARFAAALAAAAVPLTLARWLEHPERGAESAYLGTLVALLLMVVAALPPAGPRRRDPLPAAATLSALAVLALPVGPVRGATVVSLLVAAVAIALACRLGAPAGRWRDETALLLPVAVAVQVAFRGAALLTPSVDLHSVVVYVAMPLAVAAAGTLLTLRYGRTAVWIAAAAAVTFAGGFHVASTLALVAPAAGEILGRPPARRPTLGRVTAAAVLLAPFVWQQRTAALAVLVALGMAALAAGRAGNRGRAARLVLAATVTAVGLVAAFGAPLRPWTEALPALAVLAVALPLLPWSLLRDGRTAPGRLLPAVAGLALALAAARCAPDVSALALPAALLAFTLAAPAAADGAPSRGRGIALQAGWSVVLTVVAALLAAYPWLRPQPAAAALDLLRLDATGASALWLLVLATVAALLPVPAPLRRAALPGLLAAGLLYAVPHAAPPRPLAASPVAELDARSGQREIELTGPAGRPPAAISALIARCHLSYATQLAGGTPVFDLLLYGDGDDDEPAIRWTFRAGVETGEWAARRPDIAAALAHRTPPPFVTWVAPGGDFFGQTYRSRLELPRPVVPHRLVLRRRADLPRRVRVHVERLEGAP